MQPSSWWWRSVAACASVLVLAGVVAVIAGAVDGDRATALRLAADRPAAAAPAASSAPAPSPAPSPAASAAPAPGSSPRVPDATTGTSLALPPGWLVVPTQDVVEVPPGRFEGATIVRRGPGTVVLVGLADPGRVPSRADPARPDAPGDQALGAEARRLADAYADIVAPGVDTADLRDDAEPVGGLPTRTSVRRVEGGALDGALVRVSTVAAPGRTVAVLAVARPSPTVGADGDAADAVVRSLRADPAGSPGRSGRPAP